MKKTTIYYWLEFLCMVLLLVSIVLCRKLITDPNLEWIIIIPCVVIFVPAFIIEWKREQFRKNESTKQEEITKKKFLELLTARQDESPTLQVMHQIVIGVCLEINPLLTKYNLIIDNDYDDEDHILELEIHSADIKGKRMYFSSLSSNNDMLLEGTELNVSEMNEAEIISIWIKDIENFFSKINQK